MTDPDMITLVNDGVSPALLAQGTESNIEYYFGLAWQQVGGYWKCVHTGTGAAIQSLSDVAGGANGTRHEPDFLELLKTAITTGALEIRPPFMRLPPSPPPRFPETSATVRWTPRPCKSRPTSSISSTWTASRRASSARSVPPPIPNSSRRSAGGKPAVPVFRAQRGLEGRGCQHDDDARPEAPETTERRLARFRRDAGLCDHGADFRSWTPHFYYSSVSTNPPSGLTPAGLGVAAYGGLPPDVASLAVDYLGQAPSAVNAAVRSTVYSGAGSTFGDARESSPAVTAHALNQTSTLLKFSNTPFAYREPTLLVKPGTNITDATAFQTAVKGDLGVSSFTVRETPTVYNGSDPSPGNFVGIYLGKGPVEWPSTVGSPHTDVGAGLRMDTSANVTTTTPPVLTYQLLCDNPNAPGSLMVYDEKSFFSEGYTTPITQTLMYSPANPPPAASGDYQAQMLGGNRLMTGFDPRTSRFGMQNSNFGESVDPTFVDDFPPNHPGTTLWLDASNGIVPGD